MPHLWHILSVLTRNDSHSYRKRQRSPLPKEEDQADTQIQAMAVNMLYYSWSRSLRRMQTWFGVCLHHAQKIM